VKFGIYVHLARFTWSIAGECYLIPHYLKLKLTDGQVSAGEVGVVPVVVLPAVVPAVLLNMWMSWLMLEAVLLNNFGQNLRIKIKIDTFLHKYWFACSFCHIKFTGETFN
jgi:hypothetical protein